MSDTATKRPAHEVILDAISKKYAVLESCAAGDGRSLHSGIDALLFVLGHMVIPNDHRTEIISRLREYHERYVSRYMPRETSPVWLLAYELERDGEE